jgi:gamma-glutamylcyclotransferase (GGCT)/AIG2-like uncharacterized protein YtfP
MTEDLLFVYGTLRRDTSSEMHHLLARYAAFVSEGTYQGQLYRVDDYPGVVPSDDPAERVKGEVYALTEPETVLAKLDRYEECGPGFAEPGEYIRRREEILLSDNTTLHAWVYIYDRPTDNLERIPFGDFLAHEVDQVKSIEPGKTCP